MQATSLSEFIDEQGGEDEVITWIDAEASRLLGASWWRQEMHDIETALVEEHPELPAYQEVYRDALCWSGLVGLARDAAMT